MKRVEVIALLKKITADGDIIPAWVSLVNAKSDDYELHIKSERGLGFLRADCEEHNLALKEVNGFWIIYRKCCVHEKLPKKAKRER